MTSFEGEQENNNDNYDWNHIMNQKRRNYRGQLMAYSLAKWKSLFGTLIFTSTSNSSKKQEGKPFDNNQQ
jgi:hypothetical protein